MITVGLSSHLGPWPLPTCLAFPALHTWRCQQSGCCPGSPGEKLMNYFSYNALIPGDCRRSLVSQLDLPLPPTSCKVHYVQPMPIGRRVTQVSDRSTTGCVKMSRSIRDDLGTSLLTPIFQDIPGQETFFITILSCTYHSVQIQLFFFGIS